jgi:hypothetical protein
MPPFVGDGQPDAGSASFVIGANLGFILFASSSSVGAGVPKMALLIARAAKTGAGVSGASKWVSSIAKVSYVCDMRRIPLLPWSAFASVAGCPRHQESILIKL